MRKVICVVACFCALLGCSEKEQVKNLRITGTIKGLKKGKLYIQELRDSTLVAVDSVTFDGNSTFDTQIDLSSPQMLYLFLDRGVTNNIDNNLQFFAEPGKINVDTTLESFYGEADITGSKNNELYEQFKVVDARYRTQLLELSVQNLKPDNKVLLSAADLEKQNNDIVKRKYLYAINFALNNKSHEVAPYIALSEISNANMKYLDTIQNALTPEVAKSKYGKLLAKHIAERRQLEK